MQPIRLDKTDKAFEHMLRKAFPEGDPWACFACRTCTVSCPVWVSGGGSLDPSRLMRMALYGLKDEILEGGEIWLCTGCYACQERCPQGVRITSILTAFKNLAVASGHAPGGIRTQRELLLTHGRIYPLDEFDNKKREKAGLPSLPHGCDTVRRLLEAEQEDPNGAGEGDVQGGI